MALGEIQCTEMWHPRGYDHSTKPSRPRKRPHNSPIVLVRFRIRKTGKQQIHRRPVGLVDPHSVSEKQRTFLTTLPSKRCTYVERTQGRSLDQMRMTSSRQPSGTPEKNKLIAITSPPLFFLFHSHNCLSQSRTHPRRAKARAPFALPTSYRVRHTPKKPSLSVARAVFPQTTLGTHSQVNLFSFSSPFLVTS